MKEKFLMQYSMQKRAISFTNWQIKLPKLDIYYFIVITGSIPLLVDY